MQHEAKVGARGLQIRDIKGVARSPQVINQTSLTNSAQPDAQKTP